MKIQTILRILVLVLGAIGLVLLGTIIAKGDDEIKAAALGGDYGSVSPIITLALIILVVVVAVTLIFTLLNLVSHPAKLKKALLSIGVFAAIVAVAYGLSTGVETPMKDGEVLSASGSRWVGAGLRTFYFLAVIAIGAMVFSGIKKMIK